MTEANDITKTLSKQFLHHSNKYMKMYMSEPVSSETAIYKSVCFSLLILDWRKSH